MEKMQTCLPFISYLKKIFGVNLGQFQDIRIFLMAVLNFS